MGFIKYSIGGKIKEVTADSTASDPNVIASNDDAGDGHLVICSKCKIQHVLAVNEKNRKCNCGNIIEIN